MVTFFEDYMVLYYEKLGVDLGDLEPDSEIFHELFLSTQHQILRLMSDYYRLLVYSVDNQIALSAEKVIDTLPTILKIYKKNFYGIRNGMSEVISVQDNEKLCKEKNIELDKIFEKYHKEMNPAINDMREAFGKYFQALNKYNNTNHKLKF